MTNKDNLEKVKAMVKTMEQYASGDFFIWNGDLFPIDERDFCEVDGCTIQRENVMGDIHTFYIMPDGTMIFEGDLEIATIDDYFDDFLDVDYVVGSDKKYKACRVLVAFGGPNIYIDTWEQEVQLSWWGEHAEAAIPTSLCEEIDNYFEMLFNC